jgi:hypothetical protein
MLLAGGCVLSVNHSDSMRATAARHIPRCH